MEALAKSQYLATLRNIAQYLFVVAQYCAISQYLFDVAQYCATLRNIAIAILRLRNIAQCCAMSFLKTLSYFQITEIVNDPNLESVPIESRNCRFPHENPLTSYPYYSYSACVVECHAKAQMRLCGCYHHFIPSQSKYFC